MAEPVVRPTFLTILCFLTFMSAVSGLWTQSERLWNPGIIADQTRETFQVVQEKLEGQASEAEMETVNNMFDAVISQTTASNIRTGAIILIIFESLSLYAAYLIWNLQKKGFYLFLAGIAFTFLAPLIFIGGWLGFITAMAGVFFSVLLAILFAVNLKHMY
ncbi:hypothetical protein DYBT9275_03594 [Dyadobacter sp. CECT 9275]|uniref:Uncharacterized protein n=1 Tax=Dyadobacter helix TaxID=2822344 RepID=A0A916N6V0_9BACT|nr:hypothetical protein [Dyadobacter sp. CECT 9275]CAG5005504.1 hypothetical protein DYBT9275_03594 [Dyadobacter sp. CECT 9275]